MSPPISLAELARAPRPIAEVGGKAFNLARMVAAGIAVPEGWVIPASDTGSIDAAALGGGRYAVRSSSPIEDRPERVAPGVFASIVDVGPGELDAAVAAVRASATGELAALYAEATGAKLPPSMAVIVQRFIRPDRAGTVYTRAPGRPDTLVIEARGRAPISIDRADGPPPRWAPLIDACLAAESALELDAADVEWVERGAEVYLVQARPLPLSPALERPPASAFDFARADPETTWRLDLAHNPAPLSPAQQGLVELVVDRSGARLALACGWLYQAVSPRDPHSGAEADADLESLFFEQVEPEADALLSGLESAPPDLEPALDGFARVHELYGRVTGALSAARRRAAGRGRPGSIRTQALALSGDPRAAPSTRERARRLAALAPAELYAPYATGWDVAAPPIKQPPEPTSPAPSGSGVWSDDLCAAIGELDDRLFYRAQAAVRRALLATGLGDDAFWLPLADVRAGAVSSAAARADAARALHERQAALWMPVEARGDALLDRAVGLDRRALRGRGFGGRATGRILKLPASTIPGGSVVAAVELTPADALAARQASGIVLEAGSLLGHGAAMARELGIPIIVQVPGLCRIVTDGEPVVLDGEAGVLLRAF